MVHSGITARRPAAVLIFDSHLDLALNAVDWNRDLRMAIAEIRAQETMLGMTDPGRRTNTVSFPELRRAKVGVGVATVLARQEQPINHPFGYTLSMECADPVLDPDNIREWYEHGLRAIGITHYGANRYGGGTRCEVGLAVDALPLLRNIEQLGIALDMTHLSDPA